MAVLLLLLLLLSLYFFQVVLQFILNLSMLLNGVSQQCALFEHKPTCENFTVCTETCNGQGCALVYINLVGKLAQVLTLLCQPEQKFICTKMEDDKDECHLKRLKIVGEHWDMHMCCCTGSMCNYRNEVFNKSKFSP